MDAVLAAGALRRGAAFGRPCAERLPGRSLSCAAGVLGVVTWPVFNGKR